MSKLSRLVVVVALAVLAASVVSRFGTSNSHAEFLGNLGASVGPGFEIQLKLADGTVVSSLAAGTYAIHVNDSATEHNFHIEGQGVSQATGVESVEEADWTLDFVDGYYTYHCDRHQSLSATFAVGYVPAAPARAPPPAPVTVYVPPVSTAPVPVVVATKAPAKTSTPSTLNVLLAANDRLTVLRSGKAVKKLAQGTYTFVVSDKSSKRDLSLRRIGGTSSVLTTRAYRGTKTVRIKLSPGQWKLFSAANEQGVFSFFTVTKN
jgi:hypothetical protein